jgi:hypothetical protein
MIAEKDNLCYKISASRMTVAMERIARREVISKSRSREEFFIPNGRNPLKSPDSKK